MPLENANKKGEEGLHSSRQHNNLSPAKKTTELNCENEVNTRTMAIFAGKKSPNVFIVEQAAIMGYSRRLAEHDPDYGHVQKGVNNKLFKIRKEIPSLKGTPGLRNERIKSIHSDLRGPILDYNNEGVGNNHINEEDLGNDDTRCNCLKQMVLFISNMPEIIQSVFKISIARCQSEECKSIAVGMQIQRGRPKKFKHKL